MVIFKKAQLSKVEGCNLNRLEKANLLSRQEKFNNIIEMAKEILEKEYTQEVEEHPIFNYIRLLGRGIQTEYMSYLLHSQKKDTGWVPRLEWETVGFPRSRNLASGCMEVINLDTLKKEISSNKKIDLNKDLILPWPWKKERLLDCMCNIGKGRDWGHWQQDDTNHNIEVWLPMGIAWVNGGNHSLTMGILQGGNIEVNLYYDISSVYDYVRCDGNNFIKIQNNKIIDPVLNIEFAAIFEIGRLLKEKGISFLGESY